MSGYLLDTNCISELVRDQPDPGVTAWIDSAEEELLFLSVLTFGEIRKGLAELPQSTRRTQLEVWMELELRVRFAGRILPIDVSVTDRWGVLAASAKKQGKTLSTIDGMLAATALQHNLTVVSRNGKDFAPAQVQVLNPWLG